jgi:beta-lactamase regulating signal transducer with metallopeptidase domain
MLAELCAILARINLVGSLGVLAVLALRHPLRRAFGAEVAYALWAAPALAVAAALLPAPVLPGVPEPASLAQIFTGWAPVLATLWLVGAGVMAALFFRAQLRFLRAARAGRAGPAVVGVIAPRIVMPPDDGRYTAAERALVRAHERAHIDRGDPRAVAGMALARCLFWFNPLVHLAVHVARLDQELACDATVVRRLPGARALYAQTLLKSQLADAPLPIGCHWPARGAHPLEVRIRALLPTRRRDGLLGGVLVTGLVLTGAYAAWAIQPPIPRPTLITKFEIPDDTPAMSVVLISTRRASAPRTR